MSGGLTATSDINSVLENDSVSGVALGGSLHYKKQKINLLKEQLIAKNIIIRSSNSRNFLL